jgi:hypothetical protein
MEITPRLQSNSIPKLLRPKDLFKEINQQLSPK